MFLERLQKLYPDNFAQIQEAQSATRLTTFRRNSLKTTPGSLKKLLALEKIETEQVDWNPDAFILKSPNLRQLTETAVYKQGLIYVQSLSSMLPALILDPQPGEKILDLCAAPGSKTTQMAALMKNSGEIVANDNSRIRIYKLEANLKLQGVTNTKVLNEHGEVIWKKYPQYFDRTLVDVPCSMEGRFLLSEPKTYAFWSMKKVKELRQRQRFLLRSAVSCTKVGGCIVYSTCTLAPEENEGVIDWLMKKESGNIELETIVLPNLTTGKVVGDWNGKSYNPEVSKCVRILPSKMMEGFFVAKLRKISPNIG